jgi:hypothetical protein
VAQTFPHEPQLLVLEVMFISQPLVTLPSQSAKPRLHVILQMPAEQPGLEFGRAAQAFPHEPQLLTLELISASQPFAASLSQFFSGPLHGTQLLTLQKEVVPQLVLVREYEHKFDEHVPGRL